MRNAGLITGQSLHWNEWLVGLAPLMYNGPMTDPLWKWLDLAAFWETVPKRSSAVFLAAVFCLLCALAFIENPLNSRALTPGQIAVNVVAGGCFPAVWALILMRRMFKTVFAMAAVQAVEIWWRFRFDQGTPELPFNSAAFQGKLTTDAVVAIIMLLAAYLLFILFFQWEGKRFLPHTPR